MSESIYGSKAEGKKVVANIGGNLNIQSEQERNDYDSHSSSVGGEFGTGIASKYTSGSAGVSKGKIDSRYQSVTDQAGIYAGNDGFDIDVKGNTDLKGAVIDSRAPAEKNHLTTGTLTWEDTGNKADYKASGEGISYAGKDAKLNARGLTPNIAPTVKDSADSTTKSAVAEGTITITNTKDQKQNVSDLNRDTKNTLNKLKEIFDKDKVQEKQEFIGLLSKDLNEAIHKVADQNHWADGSKEKVALHALVSGMLSEMSGAGFSSGSFAGGVNEYVIGYLIRTKHEQWMLDHPDLVEWISTAVGGIVSKAVGGDISKGAETALAGTKWNALSDEQALQFKADIDDLRDRLQNGTKEERAVAQLELLGILDEYKSLSIRNTTSKISKQQLRKFILEVLYGKNLPNTYTLDEIVVTAYRKNTETNKILDDIDRYIDYDHYSFTDEDKHFERTERYLLQSIVQNPTLYAKAAINLIKSGKYTSDALLAGVDLLASVRSKSLKVSSLFRIVSKGERGIAAQRLEKAKKIDILHADRQEPVNFGMRANQSGAKIKYLIQMNWQNSICNFRGQNRVEI